MPIPAETAPQKPPRRRETAQEAVKDFSKHNVPLLVFLGATVIFALVLAATLQDLVLTFRVVLTWVAGGLTAYVAARVR